MSLIQFKITARTDQGHVRTNNEDNFVVNPDLSKKSWLCPQDADSKLNLSKEGCLLVVADGMGGMNAGEEASKTAVKTVEELFQPDNLPADENAIEKYMKNAVVEADKRIKAKGKTDPELEGMGTTIVMCWIHGNKAHVAWCGDSRAYSYHAKSGIKRLSKDHSYVQELVDKGELQPELAFEHPDSNIITRSLGDPTKKAQADYLAVDIHNGEVFLLCSDGLCGLLRDSEIESVLSKHNGNFPQCRDALIKGALDAGGYDNVTVAFCQIVSGAAEMPKVAKEKLYDTVKDGMGQDIPLAKVNRKRLVGRAIALLVACVFLVCGVVLFCNKDKNETNTTCPNSDVDSVDKDDITCPNSDVDSVDKADITCPNTDVNSVDKADTANVRKDKVPNLKTRNKSKKKKPSRKNVSNEKQYEELTPIIDKKEHDFSDQDSSARSE